MNKRLDEIIDLEEKGDFDSAISLLKILVIKTDFDDNEWHQLGKLYQLKRIYDKAYRSYQLALKINPNSAKTLNNLSLLALEMLNSKLAEKYILEAFQISGMDNDMQSLLLNTLCQVRIFEQKHQEALEIAKKQVIIKKSARSLSNLAICLQWVGDVDSALNMQIKALEMKIDTPKGSCLKRKIINDFLLSPQENIQTSVDLHTQIMNFGVLSLIKNPNDSYSQRLLLAGMGSQKSFWDNPDLRKNIWEGCTTDELILWDDQGFGDTFQNLGWIKEAAKRTNKLRILVRKPLINFTKERLFIPKNCKLEILDNNLVPWNAKGKHLGMWYLPIIMNSWNKGILNRGNPLLKKQSPMIKNSLGLVWNAGKHKNRQPEINARLRDIPFKLLIKEAQNWASNNNFTLKCLQQEPLDKEVYKTIESGLLQRTNQSLDWENTARTVQELRAVVTVDTAMAHFCGILDVPCVVLLNKPCDWRWGQEDSHTSLYESIRLARCIDFNDWESALQQVPHLLHEMLDN